MWEFFRNFVHGKRKEYDDSGNVTEISYYGISGEPCYAKWGYHKEVSEYDELGNCISRTYYGTEKAYFDTEGKPCLFIDAKIGIGYARYTCEYDERGNLSKETYYDKDGKEVQVADD